MQWALGSPCRTKSALKEKFQFILGTLKGNTGSYATLYIVLMVFKAFSLFGTFKIGSPNENKTLGAQSISIKLDSAIPIMCLVKFCLLIDCIPSYISQKYAII